MGRSKSAKKPPIHALQSSQMNKGSLDRNLRSQGIELVNADGSGLLEHNASKDKKQQRRRRSKGRGKSTGPQEARDKENSLQRSVPSKVRNGRHALSPIALAAFNTPSDLSAMAKIFPRIQQTSKTPLEPSNTDFHVGEDKQNTSGVSYEVSNNLADSLSSCTKDSASSAAQVDHAKVWSNAIFYPKMSGEESTHTVSTVSQGDGSPHSTSSKYVAANISSGISTKVENALRCEENKTQGGDTCIRNEDSEKSDERATIGHGNVGLSFASDAGGVAGSSPASEVSYGSQGSEWFTPMNTRRDLGSCGASSRKYDLKNEKMLEILSTKKNLFDSNNEQDRYANTTSIKGMDSAVTGHYLSVVSSTKNELNVVETFLIGNQETDHRSFDAELANVQETGQVVFSKFQTNERTTLHSTSEACAVLHSQPRSQRDVCVVQVEAQLEDEIGRGLEEEIANKISHLKKKLEELHARQKSRCSSRDHLPNVLSSKFSPTAIGTLPIENTSKSVIKSSPSMGKRRKGRVISAKFLDWQSRSPVCVGSKSVGKKVDASKSLIAGKITTPPCFKKQFESGRGAAPAIKERSAQSSAVGCTNGKLTTKLSSERQNVCLKGQEASKDATVKSSVQQRTSKRKLGGHVGISQKQHMGEDLLNAGKDQNSSQSPAFIWNFCSKRFDWVKTLRSGECGAYSSPSKNNIGEFPVRSIAGSLGCSKHSTLIARSEAPQAVQVGSEVKEGLMTALVAGTRTHLKSQISNLSRRVAVSKTVTKDKPEKKGRSDHQHMHIPKDQTRYLSTSVKQEKIEISTKSCMKKSCAKPRKTMKPSKVLMQQPLPSSTCLPNKKENMCNVTTTITESIPTSSEAQSMEKQVHKVFIGEMDNVSKVEMKDKQELYIKETGGELSSSELIKEIQVQPNNDAAACSNSPRTPDNLNDERRLLRKINTTWDAPCSPRDSGSVKRTADRPNPPCFDPEAI